MRRLREAGIVTVLLLGLTGCAGVQQRMGWTEPPYLGDEGSEERPLSRLAFWRRHRAEETAPAAAAAAPGSAETGRSTMVAGKDMSPDVDDEDRPGLLRRLPLLGRLWKNGDRGEADEFDVPVSRYTPGPVSTAAIASVPARSPASAPVAPTQAADATPAPSPASPAAPATAAIPPIGADDEPLRELSVDLAGTRPQVDAAAVPARNASSAAEPDAPPPVGALLPEPAPEPAGAPDPQQRSLPAPPPSPSLGGEEAPPPTATPGGQPAAGPDLSPAPTREPSLPSTTTGAQPALGSSWSPTVISTPGPLWTSAGQTTFTGSVQSLVATSPQASYVSGGCDEPCGGGGKCKLHKLCPFKKHKQKAMIASEYSSVVLPSAQGGISSCGGACKVKKPCFLKTWMHHKSGCKARGCKGCKSCSYCGEPATMASVQGSIVSPQW